MGSRIRLEGESKMKVKPHWSSYIPCLLRAMLNSEGDVLELGTGLVSTPLLHWLCFDMDRKLVSYEGDKKYADMNASFACDFHEVIYAPDWDAIDIEKKWGVALVDHQPDERRHVEIARLAQFADFIIAHDSQPRWEKKFRYNDVSRLFKYRYDDKNSKTHTTVFSNFKEL